MEKALKEEWILLLFWSSFRTGISLKDLEITLDLNTSDGIRVRAAFTLWPPKSAGRGIGWPNFCPTQDDHFFG